VTRVWTWHETELAPGRGAPSEARAWLGFVFGLRGPVALDIEIAASELVLQIQESGSLRAEDVIELSADRPPGAVHVEISTQSRFDIGDDCAAMLDERTSAWGEATEDGTHTVWFEVSIPSASDELEVVDDVDLIERMRVDERAGTELVTRYEPLVRRLVARYRKSGAETEDLLQVASEALVGAAHRFEPSKGVFERFASRTISGTLKRYFRDLGWAVKPPRGLQEAVLELRAAEEELGQRLGRSPTADELAADTGRPLDEIARARQAAQVYEAQPIDETYDGKGIIDAAVARAAGWATVDLAMDSLEDREREIVRLRYFEDLSQRQIADRIGVSQMHVSRLLRSSIEAMRQTVGVAP
jgi:RNA polymerase sigma-B factor